MSQPPVSTIINTKTVPPGYHQYRNSGMVSRAYYDMSPYPYFGFQNWKTEELGPYPICPPIPYAIIRRSAIWLFGKPINFHVPNAKEVEKDLRKHWQLNKMDNRLVSTAELGGIEGEFSLKFSYDSTADVPLRFQVLSNVNQVRYYYDPLDSEKVAMVRIQFPYYDPVYNNGEGSWFWYREEWTKEEEIHYKSVQILNFSADPRNPYDYSGSPVYPEVDTATTWEITSRGPNRFGIIPIHKVKNIDTGGLYGKGDLFRLERIIDRISLTYYLMDRDNQLNIDPNHIFIDLIPADSDGTDQPTMPGGRTVLESRESEDGVVVPGKVQTLEASTSIREYLHKFADEMKEMLFDATGAVFPRQSEVTNKGAMTQSVMIQLFAPLLEVTNEKRKSYGDAGLGIFLKMVIIGLKNLGIKPYNKLSSVKSLVDDKISINFTWFTQFEATEDELFSCFDRLDREAQGGYLPTESIVRKIAQLEELNLSEEEITELANKVDGRIADRIAAESQKGSISTSGKKSGNDPSTSKAGEGKSKQPRRSNQITRGKTTKDAT